MRPTQLVLPNVESYIFKVVVEPDSFADGTPAYHAYIPVLRGCSTWGYTVEEALTNVAEAAKLLVDLMIERGESIPQEVDVKAEPRITVNLQRS